MEPPSTDAAVEAPGLPAPEPLAPRRWRELDRPQRVRRVCAIAFASFAIVGALYRLLPDSVTRVMPGFVQEPMRTWYRSLGGAGRWDMFVTPPRDRPVVIEGRGRRGAWFVLLDPLAEDRGLFRRVVDARLRKFVQKFTQQGQRARLGRPFLAWVCREAAEEHPELRFARIVQRPHPFRDHGDAAKPKTLLTFRCGDPIEPRAKAPPRPARRGGRGPRARPEEGAPTDEGL